MVFVTLLAVVSLATSSALAAKQEQQGSKHLYQRRHPRDLQKRAGFTLTDTFQGAKFFDGFKFNTFPDPTHGAVQYVSKDVAFAEGLAAVKDGVAFMTVDAKTKLAPGQNRKSVRIESTKKFNQGLFILDVKSMPHGPTVWPAAWMVGDPWPQNGEIDIIEGVHDRAFNQMTLHTNPGCTIDTSKGDANANAPSFAAKPKDKVFTGKVEAANLRCDATLPGNIGCPITDTNNKSYGKGLNDQGGGVFAMLWDNDGVRIWQFDRNAIPSDAKTDNPNPAFWPAPKAFFSSSTCSATKFFRDLTFVFDITLCGDFATPTFKETGLPGTCADRIPDPNNFKTANWQINSLKVFAVPTAGAPAPAPQPAPKPAPKPAPQPAPKPAPAPAKGDVPTNLIPEFGFAAGRNPTGTGDCDGAVNGGDGKPIKIPCACPPNRADFIKKLNDNVRAGHAVKNPSVAVSFPLGTSKADQLARMQTAIVTLQNLNGPGQGCPVVATTFLAQQKAIADFQAQPAPKPAPNPAPKPAPKPAAPQNDIASLAPDLGFSKGRNPTGTGDCDGAVKGPNGQAIKIPCACPPDRGDFIAALTKDINAGHPVNNPGIPFSFPRGQSKEDKIARIQAAIVTLQNLNGPGKGCPAVATTLLAQQKALTG